ncbi:MAG: AAA family ATPase [Bacteroidia bacterium]|nr:AAA family ATPase [Bacteroidia bacterium]
MANNSENILSTRDRIDQLIRQLSQNLFEKEKVIRLTLLSALAGQSIFLLGPPGVAKSMIARRLKFAFAGANSFEYLMGKFSTPDEVFGPVSISKLRNEDKYERLTAKYLPGANIVFLDEIWKASPPIQNALLTVLNEKIYRNGEQEFKVDIRGLISASNELPIKGEGLEALWDRFLIRVVITNIESEDLFTKMISLAGNHDYEDMVSENLKISNEEYNLWEKEIEKIEIPPHILGLITYLRRIVRQRNSKAEENNLMYVSDRRWKKIVHVLRAAAFINGRSSVDLMDCFLISDCLWDHPEQIAEAEELVVKGISSFGYYRLINADRIREELEGILREVEAETHIIKFEKVKQRKVYHDKAENVYHKVFDFWGTDSSAYVRPEDLAKLDKEKPVYIPLFEQSGKSFRPFQTYGVLLKSEYVLFNNQRELKIESEEIDKESRTQKKPAEGIVRIWNTQIELLLETCEKMLGKIEVQKKLDEPNFHNHLFVSKNLSAHISASLDTVTNELLNLKLDIKKARHSYESINPN